MAERVGGEVAASVDGGVDGAGRTLLPALATLPGHLLWRASARVALTVATALPPEVDLHARAVLLALDDDVARSQQELADAVMKSRTTMARVAADLVERGLVDRVRNPRDRRSYALTRTAAGADAVREGHAHAVRIDEALTPSLDAGERRELHRLLLAAAAADLAPDLPAELRGSSGFLISQLHARLHRDYLEALAPLDLEPRDVGSLTALQSVGPVSQSELARALGVSAATVVEIADALEARGLIERRRAPDDRRTQLLHVRRGADATMAQARTVALEVNRRWLGPLDEAEREVLLGLLRRLITEA